MTEIKTSTEAETKTLQSDRKTPQFVDSSNWFALKDGRKLSLHKLTLVPEKDKQLAD